MLTDFDFQPIPEYYPEPLTPQEGCLGCIVTCVIFAAIFIVIMIIELTIER